MYDYENEPLSSASSVPIYLQACASKECPTCKGRGKIEKGIPLYSLEHTKYRLF
jgi:hypothetical protein